MNYIVDWLTLTLKPEKIGASYSPISFVEEVCPLEKWCFDFLSLKDYKNSFRRKQGSIQHYNVMYSYNGIDIALSTPERFSEQGLMLRFSSEGLAFLEKVKKVNDKNWTVVKFLKEFFAFGVYGFTCKCTRIDLAFDDISYDDNRLIDLSVVEKALKKGEFVSLFRFDNPDNPLHQLPARQQIKRKKGEVLGNTINVGNRKSKVFLRFYDKLKELQSHKKEYDENIKHWVRMEFEFKDLRAMSVCDSLIVLNQEEFGQYISQVTNRYIRFIVPKGDKKHYYRCSQRKWWTKIVGTIEKAKLVENKAYKNRFNSTMKWLRRSVFPTLFAVLNCMNVDEFITDVRVQGYEHFKEHHNEIINDYVGNPKEENYKGLDIHKISSRAYERILEELHKLAKDNKHKALGFELCNILDMDNEYEKYHGYNVEGSYDKTIWQFITSEEARAASLKEAEQAIDFFTYGY